MLHFVLQKSRRISHTGFLHVPRSWLEDTNPPLVGIAGSVLANYRAYRCFVSAWTAKQKRRLYQTPHQVQQVSKFKTRLSSSSAALAWEP